MRLLAAVLLATLAAAAEREFDIVVYSATPAGIAAAVSAARLGRSVVLIEETDRIGGMLTSGLSYTDFRSLESVQGFFRDYMERVEANYRKTYGNDSQQVKDCFFGAHAEPKVSLQILEAMIREQRTLTLVTNQTIEAVARPGRGFVTSVVLANGDRINGRFFIDASYEGDLAARAGFRARVGREGIREYGERLAGHIFFRRGQILEGSTGEGDSKVQCYNFRVIMTDRQEQAAPVPKPAVYDPAEYKLLAEYLANGQLAKVFTENHDGVLRIQRIPNGKADINDINTSPIGFGLPGENWEYPEGDASIRRRIFERHRNYAQGLLWFLQNDPSVPEAARQDARRWGLAKDEFTATGNFPPRLYVREARRFLGRQVFTEADVRMDAATMRTRSQPLSVAVGDYVVNSHGVDKPGSLHPGVREGYVVSGSVPYQVPYGVMVPETSENVLAPVAVSASHIGYCALRLEPIWTALGQAAGIAAHLAIADSRGAGAVDVPKLQRELHRQGAMTFYVSDVPRTSPRFRIVQALGNKGIFHEARRGPIPERKHRHGLQYSYPPAFHDARLDELLDERTYDEWALRLGWNIPPRQPGETRGQFIDRLAKLNPGLW